MDQLREAYLEGLQGRAKALEACMPGHAGDPQETWETMRRIAHSLRGSGATYGFPEITVAATVLEDADEDDRLLALRRLMTVVKEVIAAGHTTPMRILLVEDDPEVVVLLEEKLGGSNRRVIVCNSAEKARSLLVSSAFSLIILDIILPDTDGRALISELREHSATQDLPVIVLSALTDPRTRTECFALGADEYVVKPFDAAILAASISRRFEKGLQREGMATRDALTGLLNRTGLSGALRSTLSLAQRTGTDTSLALINLDGFVEINREYGCTAGNVALGSFADFLRGHLRESDFVGRWRNNEFVAILQATSQEEARTLLGQVADALSAPRRWLGDKKEHLFTISVGVVGCSSGTTLEEAVACADWCLARARTGGYGKIVCKQDLARRRQGFVLLAEDDESAADLMRKRLEAEEIDVTHASDGEAAYRAALRHDHSAIILDLRMPRLDGLELLRRLRDADSTARVPVLIVSALGSEQDIVRAFDLGADDYLVKPFAPGELVARVLRLIRRNAQAG